MPYPYSQGDIIGYDWFGDKFDDMIFDRLETGDAWLIRHRISYKSPQELGYKSCEASTVYTCELVESPRARKEAIVKIYMQIPNVESTKELEGAIGSQKFAYQAVEFHQSRACRNEINILDRLTKANCSSTPKLLFSDNFHQNDTLWVPGGYIWFIFQEKVPGVPLDEVWKPDIMSDEKKATIRDAFKVAIFEVQSHYVGQYDEKSRNCLWDAKQNKCYMIDFEHSGIILDEHFSCLDDTDYENSLFLHWGLADEETYRWQQEFHQRCKQEVKLQEAERTPEEAVLHMEWNCKC